MVRVSDSRPPGLGFESRLEAFLVCDLREGAVDHAVNTVLIKYKNTRPRWAGKTKLKYILFELRYLS